MAVVENIVIRIVTDAVKAQQQLHQLSTEMRQLASMSEKMWRAHVARENQAEATRRRGVRSQMAMEEGMVRQQLSNQRKFLAEEARIRGQQESLARKSANARTLADNKAAREAVENAQRRGRGVADAHVRAFREEVENVQRRGRGVADAHVKAHREEQRIQKDRRRAAEAASAFNERIAKQAMARQNLDAAQMKREGLQGVMAHMDAVRETQNRVRERREAANARARDDRIALLGIRGWTAAARQVGFDPTTGNLRPPGGPPPPKVPPVAGGGGWQWDWRASMVGGLIGRTIPFVGRGAGMGAALGGGIGGIPGAFAGGAIGAGLDLASKAVNSLVDGLMQVAHWTQDAVKWAIQLAIEYGRGAAQFETLAGTAEQGRKLFEDIQVLAIRTPFRAEQLVPAGERLLALGLDPEAVISAMARMADIAGGSTVKLQRLSLALGQVMAAGRLRGTELRQLTEVGVGLGDLAKAAGISKEKFQDMVETGEIGTNVVIKGLNMLTSAGGRFSSASQRQLREVGGAWNSLVESVSLQVAKFTDKVLKGIGVPGGLNLASSFLRQFLTEERLGGFQASLISGGRRFTSLLIDVLPLLKSALPAIRDGFLQILESLGLGTWKEFRDVVIDWATKLPGIIKNDIVPAMQGFLTFMKEAIGLAYELGTAWLKGVGVIMRDLRKDKTKVTTKEGITELVPFEQRPKIPELPGGAQFLASRAPGSIFISKESAEAAQALIRHQERMKRDPGLIPFQNLPTAMGPTALPTAPKGLLTPFLTNPKLRERTGQMLRAGFGAFLSAVGGVYPEIPGGDTGGRLSEETRKHMDKLKERMKEGVTPLAEFRRSQEMMTKSAFILSAMDSRTTRFGGKLFVPGMEGYDRLMQQGTYDAFVKLRQSVSDRLEVKRPPAIFAGTPEAQEAINQGLERSVSQQERMLRMMEESKQMEQEANEEAKKFYEFMKSRPGLTFRVSDIY